MMKVSQLNEQVSVSDQISVDDITALKARGVTTIVCNRPDNEAEGQLNFKEVAAAAKEAGMHAFHIPFVAGNLEQKQVHAFSNLLDVGERIHAYCRTGNRSSLLLKACSAVSENATESTATSRLKSETPSSSNAHSSNRLSSSTSSAKAHYDVVIVGAGSGGIATASSLLRRSPGLRIALVDSAEFHYYQPGWTMVGGGIFDVESTKRSMSTVIPDGVTWYQHSVLEFYQDNQCIKLSNEDVVYYEHLVVAAGLHLDWAAIEGLEQTLGKNGVTSNYRYDLAPYTWKLVTELKKGKALFTQPAMPIKCAGAPQKALYLSADQWFHKGLLDADVAVHFYNAGAVLFGVKEYLPALMSYIEKYKAQTHFTHNLIKIDGESKTAWFACKAEDGSATTVSTSFDMIHVCPPQCAPDFIKQSALADANGWVEVNQYTLQHVRYKNIWGLGDVTNTPNAKTMAAVRKQAPVVAQNICDALQGSEPSVHYDGYGSCPLTVERGKIVLAEFAYGGKLSPTFPSWLNDGTQATALAWQLKANILPALYWHGMLKGREWFASPLSGSEPT